MSLAIDVDAVAEVMLPDGKWYKVAKQSFDLDSYEYLHKGEVVFGGGQVEGVPSTGAVWTGADGVRIACPLTSVVAVKVAKPKKKG